MNLAERVENVTRGRFLNNREDVRNEDWLGHPVLGKSHGTFDNASWSSSSSRLKVDNGATVLYFYLLSILFSLSIFYRHTCAVHHKAA